MLHNFWYLNPKNSHRTLRNRFYLPQSPRNVKLPFLDSSRNRIFRVIAIPITLVPNRIYRTRAIITRSWILTVHKARILRKKPLEKTFLNFKKWVKSIYTAGYNGACTVPDIKQQKLILDRRFVTWFAFIKSSGYSV